MCGEDQSQVGLISLVLIVFGEPGLDNDKSVATQAFSLEKDLLVYIIIYISCAKLFQICLLMIKSQDFLLIMICFEYCEGTSSGYINNVALINDYCIITIYYNSNIVLP